MLTSGMELSNATHLLFLLLHFLSLLSSSFSLPTPSPSVASGYFGFGLFSFWFFFVFSFLFLSLRLLFFLSFFFIFMATKTFSFFSFFYSFPSHLSLRQWEESQSPGIQATILGLRSFAKKNVESRGHPPVVFASTSHLGSTKSI